VSEGFGRANATGRNRGRSLANQVATALGGIEVDTSDPGAVLRTLGKLPTDLKRGVSEALRQSAQATAAETRALLRGSANAGFGQKVEGVVSAPGQAPASQTGLLRRSIRVRRGRRDGLSWIVSSEFYGRFLEVGARRGPRGGTLDPRPFLTTAKAKQADANRVRVGNAVAAVLQRVSAGAEL
jgi:hypothetical protein